MKKIRLIELFAGVGSQASALDRIGADFESYKISEWEINAVRSYNAIHSTDRTDYSEGMEESELDDALIKYGISADGKELLSKDKIKRKPLKEKKEIYNTFRQTKNLGSIVNIKGEDLEIVNPESFTYLLTYSFPCQDLSTAGKQKGMTKGSGTRSGLLWEVERLLNETENLPQVLLMENVPQVHGSKNMRDFEEWMEFLEEKGYTNYWQDLNSRFFGVAQNRNRTFMVSLLGGLNYEFPRGFELKKKMVDYLEENVDEKYYISNEKTEKLLENLKYQGYLKPLGFETEQNLDKKTISLRDKAEKYDGETDIAYTILSRDYKGFDNSQCNAVIECGESEKIGNLNPNSNQRLAVYNKEKSSPTLQGVMGTGGGQVPLIIDEPQLLGGLGEKKSNGGTQYYQQDRVYSSDGVAMSLPSQIPGESYKYMIEQKPISTDGRKIECANTILNGYHRTNMTGFNKDNGVLVKKVGQISSDGSQYGTVVSDQGLMSTLQAGTHGYANNVICETLKIKANNKKGYYELKEGGIIDLTYPSSTTRRGRVQGKGEISPSLTVSGELHRIEKAAINYRIRKLTPRECWRLMGFNDEEFSKAEKVCSNSQLYKQAGNSIVVDVLCYIFKNIIDAIENPEKIKGQTTIFDFFN